MRMPAETYTVEELLYGLMLVSGNDAAAALACTVCGDESTFDKNERNCLRLGMTDSVLSANPNGLDADGHYSTARDMARLTAYCMENDDFRGIASTNCDRY